MGRKERWNRVVNAIIKARGSGVLQRTISAAELVAAAVGGHKSRQRIHPATKTFQDSHSDKWRVGGIGYNFAQSFSSP